MSAGSGESKVVPIAAAAVVVVIVVLAMVFGGGSTPAVKVDPGDPGVPVLPDPVDPKTPAGMGHNDKHEHAHPEGPLDADEIQERLSDFILKDRTAWRNHWNRQTPKWSDRSAADRNNLLAVRGEFENLLKKNLEKTLKVWELPLDKDQALAMANVWGLLRQMTDGGAEIPFTVVRKGAEAELKALKEDPGYRAEVMKKLGRP
jgi:hypothetical protein